jgi:hypothetical protein
MLVWSDARRRIVALHLITTRPAGDDHVVELCSGCGHPEPCPTLRLLSLPYADHPDYREAWRP